jgi:subtilisin family serine protease
LTYARLLGILMTAAVLGGAAPSLARPASSEPPLCDLLGRILRLACSPDAAPAPSGAPTATASSLPDADPTTVETPVRDGDPHVRYDPGRLTVTFERRTSHREIHEVFQRAGVTTERAIPQIRAYMVKVAPSHRTAALAVLRASPHVASAGREPYVDALAFTPSDSDWPLQWGLRLAGFPEAWDTTSGSSRIVVAILDTGVDRSQPEFKGALVPGYDFANGDSDPNDDHGHGTSVAGIIGARANNGAGLAGICWRCSVMPVKVLDKDGTGLDSLIAAGIVWAVDHGARVINMSLGGPGNTVDLDNAIAYAVSKNVVVVAAAGNSGTTETNYPAANTSVISVAGTNASDRRYAWSNYGRWVRVAAPGCNVAPSREGRDQVFCGTSSATPVVAGLAALTLAANPKATPPEVADALQRAAVPLAGVVQSGRINAPRTLAEIQGRSTAVFRGTIAPDTPLHTFSLPVGAGRVVATLTIGGLRELVLYLYSGNSPEPVARVKGHGSLRVVRDLAAGTLRLAVSGSRRLPFVLTVGYVRPGG